MNKKRIAILVANDTVWALPFWRNALPQLRKNYDVCGIWGCEDRLTKYRGLSLVRWYASTFGVFTTLIFAAFKLKRQITNRVSGISSFQRLAGKYNIYYGYSKSPNSKKVAAWLKDQKIDIGVIMVGHVIRPEIIHSVSDGIINKHSGLLPGCKGLYPYFWAKLHGLDAGISFHRVSEEVDGGEILVQRKFTGEKNASMLRFYLDVFFASPTLLLLAIDRLTKGIGEPNLANNKDSYFSLPTREDVRRFRTEGHSIAKLTDLFYSATHNQFESQ